MMQDEKLQGQVCFWNGLSYGFIKPDDGNADIFFHLSDLPPGQLVKRGDRVSYTIAPDNRNPAKRRAVQVQVRC